MFNLSRIQLLPSQELRGTSPSGHRESWNQQRLEIYIQQSIDRYLERAVFEKNVVMQIGLLLAQ